MSVILIDRPQININVSYCEAEEDDDETTGDEAILCRRRQSSSGSHRFVVDATLLSGTKGQLSRRLRGSVSSSCE